MARIGRAVLPVIVYLSCGGCGSFGRPLLGNPGTPHAVEVYSDLEREAARYGFITVGAIRVAPYDLAGLNDLRLKQLQSLDNLTKDITNNAPSPELNTASINVTEAIAKLSLFYKGVPDFSKADAPQVNQDLFSKLQGTLNDLFAAALKSPTLEANRLDMARLRIGYLKYLSCEYENLRLLETVPLDEDHYRRMVVSLQLTALVRREEAKGAIVFLDLYPAGVDLWARSVGKELEGIHKEVRTDSDTRITLVNKINDKLKHKWPDYKKQLKKLLSRCPDQCEPQEPDLPDYEFDEGGLTDFYAEMHRYLERQHFLPKVIHVEPLDEGELITQLNLNAASDRLSLQTGGISGVLSGIFGGAAGYTGAQGQNVDQVNQLSVAFSAGDHRAGWLFLPSETHNSAPLLRPTERRIKMVLDVPRRIPAVALNVQKMFTDESLLPVSSLPFDKQLRFLNQVRNLLSEADEADGKLFTSLDPIRKTPGEYVGSTDFKSPTNWELMKSRMRNMLVQGWSEALTFQIPDEPKPEALLAQTAPVIDDGEKESSVVIRAENRVLVRNIKSAALSIEPPKSKPSFAIIPFPLPVLVFVPAAPPRKPHKFQASKIASDAEGYLVTLTFPSLKALGLKADALEQMQLLISYKMNPTPGKGESLPTVYVSKAKEKVVGFKMSVTTKQILADKAGKGVLVVRFEKPDSDKAASKIKFSIQGADFSVRTLSDLGDGNGTKPPTEKLKGMMPPQTNPTPSKENVVQPDVMVTFDLSNLSEESPVTISAQNVDDKKNPVDAPSITLRVEQIKDSPRKER